MKEKDIEQIKFDLGLCADSLMALCIGLFISEILGLIYFAVSVVIESFVFIKKNNKYFRSDVK